MFNAIFTRLNPYMLWIKLAVIAAILIATWTAGYRYRGHVEATAKLEVLISQAKAKEAMRKSADLLSIELEQKNQKRVNQTKTVIREVTKYVQTTSSCKLDAGYRSLHDLSAGNSGFSAAGSVPYAKDRTTEIATSTDSNTVLETVSENYATCLRWKDQVDGWQSFWNEVVVKK